MTAEFEEKSAFTLPASIKTLQQASKTILDVTGMEACERTDRVSSAAKSHRVLLHGVFIAGGTAGIWPSPTSPPRRRAASTWHWSSEQNVSCRHVVACRCHVVAGVVADVVADVVVMLPCCVAHVHMSMSRCNMSRCHVSLPCC
mmetsp:Transcript_8512/g.18541  ORF Transcript_8512/g.18541 Transcript_8512/m.18541 type:complete len:144 (-) Transcript_8512:137-568(-)